jgi:hypothetical protein
VRRRLRARGRPGGKRRRAKLHLANGEEHVFMLDADEEE